MLLVLDVLLIVFYYLLLSVFSMYLSLYSMYVTMSISVGLYPKLDLWNSNKLHYITLHQPQNHQQCRAFVSSSSSFFSPPQHKQTKAAKF